MLSDEQALHARNMGVEGDGLTRAGAVVDHSRVDRARGAAL
jgi:hypothetical protein